MHSRLLARFARSSNRGRTILALQIAALVVGLVLLRLVWSSVRDVVVAIDHGDLLFADFVHHYYPTVAAPLRHSGPAGGFFYPAGFAVLIAPIGWLPLSVASIVWALVQIGCVAWSATWLVRAAAPDRPMLAAVGATLTVTSIPVLHNLKWGQVSILILASAAGAFLAYRSGKKHLAALLLGVAAGIKGYPLVFLGWFAARGDVRFLLRAGSACALTLVVLPAIVMGPEHALFFQRVSTNSVLGAAEGVLRDFNSQYAPAVLARFYDGGWDAAPLEAIAWARLGSGAAIGVIALLVLVTARSQAPTIARHRDLLGFVLIACSTPFWLRTSWAHYFVHLPVAQVLLAYVFATEARSRSSWRGRTRAVLVIALLLAPSVYLSNVLGLLATEGWWYYANAGSLFFANAQVLVAAAVFVVDAHAIYWASEAAKVRDAAGDARSGVRVDRRPHRRLA
jgi:hypothetical protein